MNPYFALFFKTVGPMFFSSLVSMIESIHAPQQSTGSDKLDHALQVTAALGSAIPAIAANVEAFRAAATPLVEQAVQGLKQVQQIAQASESAV